MRNSERWKRMPGCCVLRSSLYKEARARKKSREGRCTGQSEAWDKTGHENSNTTTGKHRNGNADARGCGCVKVVLDEGTGHSVVPAVCEVCEARDHALCDEEAFAIATVLLQQQRTPRVHVGCERGKR